MAEDPPPTAGRIGVRLRQARDRRFVGRSAELAVFRAALDAPDDESAVLFVHGPGGVGKSTLLRAAEDLAHDRSTRVARLDLRTVEASPPAFCAALAGLLNGTVDDVTAGRWGAGRCVLLIDTYESAGALDGWLREQFIPGAPTGAVVVIAGRARPGPGWSVDPGWRELLSVLPLRNLEPDAVRDLLEVEGIPPARHERLLATSHGHPLALSLLIDVWRQHRPDDELSAGLAGSPDVVRALLETFVAGVPDATHRAALQVSAFARTTTEGLLRAVLGPTDPAGVLDWLRDLSFIEDGPHGVFPHDLAREVLVSDAHWRDPDGSRRLHMAVHDWIVGRLSDQATDQPDAVTDLIFLHRSNPVAAGLWDWRTFGDVYADRLRDDDRDVLLSVTTRHQGEESAAIAAHWIDRQPEGFLVFRSADTPAVGFAATLALHRFEPLDLDADPGARALWDWAQRHSPPRPGEEVYASRFYLDVDTHQSLPSRSVNPLTIASTQIWLTRRRAAWEFIVWFDDHDGAQLMEYIDFHPVPEAGFTVGGRRHTVYAHDWRRRGPDSWLELMGGREVGRTAQPVDDLEPEPTVSALSRSEFDRAVKQGLRDLHRPDALGRNPLVSARVIGDRTGAGPAETLAAVLRDAVAALAPHPKDLALQRVLDRTYLRPASTQEGAAAVLDLPISTYRRHLGRALERVADWLWERELYGWPAG